MIFASRGVNSVLGESGGVGGIPKWEIILNLEDSFSSSCYSRETSFTFVKSLLSQTCTAHINTGMGHPLEHGPPTY